MHSAGNVQCEFLSGCEKIEKAYRVNETKHFKNSKIEKGE